MSTAHSAAETDIRNDRVSQNVAVSVVFLQLAEQMPIDAVASLTL
jgi:hypothetical protein